MNAISQAPVWSKSFELLFKEYTPLLCYITKHIKDPVIREDLVMKTFGDAFTKIHLYEPAHTFSTWIGTIAKNNLVDYYRKKGREVVTINVENFIYEPVERDTPERILIRKDSELVFEEMIECLGIVDKTIVRHRIRDDLSYKEIGDIMDEDEKTIRMRFHRIKGYIKNNYLKTKNHEN